MQRVTGALVVALVGIVLPQLVLPTHAAAADLHVKALVYKTPAVAPAPLWSGFYIGGHVGHVWGRTRVDEDGVVAERNAATNGVIGGVLGGYNWQLGNFVYGLEGDFGWSNAHGVGSVVVTDPTIIHEPNAYDLRWTTHVRARAGVAVDNWMFYVAGGYALADLAFHQGATIVIPASTSDSSTISSDGGKYHGWTIGGGIETAVTRNLHGRVEYLFDDFGHKDYVGVNGDAYRVSFKSQTVRGALIWKFD